MASLFESLGNALMLPGSSVRDVLSLQNPLDQWLTPFSGANRTSGEDLVKKMGVSGDSPWLGMAVEMATDPLNLIGLGAASKVVQGVRGGQLVKKGRDAASAFRQAMKSPEAFAAWRGGVKSASPAASQASSYGMFGTPSSPVAQSIGSRAAERAGGMLEAMKKASFNPHYRNIAKGLGMQMMKNEADAANNELSALSQS